jgi:hypothetical protein
MCRRPPYDSAGAPAGDYLGDAGGDALRRIRPSSGDISPPFSNVRIICLIERMRYRLEGRGRERGANRCFKNNYEFGL